jgi:hypothetical protein
MSSTHHYDVIILGAGITGCMTAALLARKGLRVLTFVSPACRLPAVLPVTPAMERLAAAMEYPAGRLGPAPGFQLITPEIRLDFHGALPLEEEFRRELPVAGDQVLGLLRQLDDWGRRLEEILRRPGKPPSIGCSGRLAFRRRMLFNGLAAKGLSRKFPTLLEGITDNGARQVLLTLFAGLSLGDPQHLTIAEAALLWHAASRPQVLDRREFRSAIERSFQRHNIQNRPQSDIATLHGSGKRLEQVTLRDGRRVGATWFLIEIFPDAELWPKKMKIAPACVSTTVERWNLSDFDSPPSALLAPRIMLAGNPPLLLTFRQQSEDGMAATVKQAAGLSHPLPDADQVHSRLEPLLPFARYDLKRRQAQVPITSLGSRHAELFGPKRLGSNILYCGTSTRNDGMIDSRLATAAWLAASAIVKKRG